MTRRFQIFAIATAVYLPLLLLTDSPGIVKQLALGLGTAAFLAVFAERSNLRAITVAIIVATTGEIVLSLGWGLYTYRNALIPLYVPFGHGIFYALAAESARQRWMQDRERAITRSVLVAGSAIALFGLIVLHDQWGFLWWAGAAALVARSKNRILLAACFTYTMPLEWIGTWIGNWHWTATVPLVGLHAANPPSGVGILYILLDLITVAICSSVGSPASAGWVLRTRRLKPAIQPAEAGGPYRFANSAAARMTASSRRCDDGRGRSEKPCRYVCSRSSVTTAATPLARRRTRSPTPPIPLRFVERTENQRSDPL